MPTMLLVYHYYQLVYDLVHTVSPSPNQFIVSVSRELKIHMSIENRKYVDSHRERKGEREGESEMIKRKCSRHFTVYIKNIFSKLFIAVDTAKLCKNCMLCCVVVLRQNLAHTRHSCIYNLDNITQNSSQTRAIHFTLQSNRGRGRKE